MLSVGQMARRPGSNTRKAGRGSAVGEVVVHGVAEQGRRQVLSAEPVQGVRGQHGGKMGSMPKSHLPRSPRDRVSSSRREETTVSSAEPVRGMAMNSAFRCAIFIS